MAKYPCPVCGDPSAYLFWVDPEPPAGCPHEDHENWGTTKAIRNVAECAHQRAKALQAAEFRKLVPDAFVCCWRSEKSTPASRSFLDDDDR